MKRLAAWILAGAFWRVLLEAWVWTIAVLVLVLSVVEELPQTNVPFSFLFLTQVPAIWAALRLEPAPVGQTKWLREVAFATALRGVVLGSALALSGLFAARSYIGVVPGSFWLSLLAETACFLPFLAYRLCIFAWTAWRRLCEKNFLWMMVNTHLVTVFALVVLGSILARLLNADSTNPAYYPPGALAYVVLEVVRSIIPWIGVSAILLVAAIAVFFPPALLLSYLTSRRFVRRIHELAQAVRRVRQGDLDARVVPAGQDEIAGLQDDFNHMAAELQREREHVAALLKNQRELSVVVSHELRTPVAVMRAYIEHDLSEKSQSLPAGYQEDLRTLHRETLKLQGLVEELFTLSQLDERRLELRPDWIDAAAVIERVLASFRTVAWENKRIELSAQIDAPLPAVWADEKRLEQALGNLVQNAIRHTPAGGVIVLCGQPAQGSSPEALEIAVIDSGEGVAAEDLPHIWERYYRGGQGGAGRTGIGLSLVKELVEAMGGTAGVASRPGEGSRFWLRLQTKG